MIDATGGAATLTVTTQPECGWDVSSAVTWISGLSPASGQGTGNVEFRVAPNEGTATRDGDVLVNGTAVRVSQRAPCRFTPRAREPDDNPWIAVTSGSAGEGDGSVAFSVSANTGASRPATSRLPVAPSPSHFSVGRNDGKKRNGSLTVAGPNARVEQEEERRR